MNNAAIRLGMYGVLLFVLGTPALAAEPAAGAPAVKITHDCPSHVGHDFTRNDPSGVTLLDDLSRAKLVWISEHQGMGFGKTSSGGGHVYGPKAKPAGGCSVIVAGGLVIVGYFVPKIPDSFIRGPAPEATCADDVLLALDAATGAIRWKNVYEGKGFNRGAGKHNEYGPTPVAADGKVFHGGSAGRLYGVELASGKTLWETQLPFKPGLEPLNVVGSVLMVLDGSRLFGYDTATGKQLWRLESVARVPTPVKLDGSMYGVCTGGGTMRLAEPRTGKVLWAQPLEAEHSLTTTEYVVGDGRILVPAGKGGMVTCYQLSTSGAKQLWQSKDARMFECCAYRDGKFFCATMDNELFVFNGDDGAVLWQSKKETISYFHLWGDRVVHIGNHCHESIGHVCYYTSLVPGYKDLKPAGTPLAARTFLNYRGVCQYELWMRSAYADGFMFTRSINTDNGKGAILCWDLRARPSSQWRKVSLEVPGIDLTRSRKRVNAQVEMDGGALASLIMEFANTNQNAQLRGTIKEVQTSNAGRWKGLVTVEYGYDPEEWQFDLDISRPEISGTYQRNIPALAKPVEVEGSVETTLTALPAGGKRWLLILKQAIVADLTKDSPRRDMHITVDQSPDGKFSAWAWMSRFNNSTPETQLERFEVTDKAISCKATVLAHADVYLRPTQQRAGTVATDVEVALTPDGKGWKGTFKLKFGVPYSASGAVRPAKP